MADIHYWRDDTPLSCGHFRPTDVPTARASGCETCVVEAMRVALSNGDGETLFTLYADSKLKFTVSSDPAWSFGFSGFRVVDRGGNGSGVYEYWWKK